MCFCELLTLFSVPMLLRPMIYVELCICMACEERGDGSAWFPGELGPKAFAVPAMGVLPAALQKNNWLKPLRVISQFDTI